MSKARVHEMGHAYLASSLRPWFYRNSTRFPWAYYLRLVYNDGLTYDPSTKKGGARGNYLLSHVARAAQNRQYQLLVSEIVQLKKNQNDPVLDKLSLSDYMVNAAYLIIKEAEGPNILNEFSFGRKDVQNAKEAGDVKNIPTEQNYKENLKGKGFSDEEIVALASIEGLSVQDPKQMDISNHVKLDNFYYKQLLTGSNVPLQRVLTTDAQLKTIAEQFAQDKKAFHTAFGTAFVKLSELGYDGESLTHVEHFLDDHPQRWLYDKFY